MKQKAQHHAYRRRQSAPIILSLLAIIGLASILLCACPPGLAPQASPSPSPSPDPYQGLIFLSETYSGGIYALDSNSLVLHDLPFVTTALNATGEIYVHAGKGYILVGAGAEAGLFSFDFSDTSPQLSRIGNAGLCAQYLAFGSDSRAYLSVANYSDPSKNGVYSFDTENPQAGLSLLTATQSSTAYPQELILGPEGLLYLANNDCLGATASVSIIDPDGSAPTRNVAASSGGSTGVFNGSLSGTEGVFLVNCGGFDQGMNPVAGSLDFISKGGDGTYGSIKAAEGLFAARGLEIRSGLVALSGYGVSYILELGAEEAVIQEVKAEGQSFGSYDIAYKDGLIYVPGPDYGKTNNRLYIFDESGNHSSASPLSVLNDGGKTLANICFYP